jgi:hypothetical protein
MKTIKERYISKEIMLPAPELSGRKGTCKYALNILRVKLLL